MAEPLCRMCVGECGDNPFKIPDVAVDVDHIIPMARGGERLDPNNLQPLCKRHHSQKTAREDGGMGHRRVSDNV